MRVVCAGEPAPLAHLVSRRNGPHETQIELPVDLTLGTLVAVVGRRYRAAIDRRQPRPHHRKSRRRDDPHLVQELRQRLRLLRLDVDDETIGRVLRQLGAPGLEQIAADESQQQQHRQAQRQRDDLHRIGMAAPAQIRPTIAPGHVARAAQQSEQAQCAQARQPEQQEGRGETAEHGGAEFEFTRLPQQQGRQRGQTQRIARERALPGWADFAPDHAYRRHVFQLQQRRQREAKQQQQSRGKALQHRIEAGLRQGGCDKIGEPARDHRLTAIAENAAHGACRQA